jgi:hypothetical protein
VLAEALLECPPRARDVGAVAEVVRVHDDDPRAVRVSSSGGCLGVAIQVLNVKEKFENQEITFQVQEAMAMNDEGTV